VEGALPLSIFIRMSTVPLTVDLASSGVADTGSKSALRRTLRERRRTLAPQQRRQAALQVAVHLAETPAFRASRRIACYLANDGEIETDDVIAHIRRQRKHCFLPVLSRLGHDRLWFAPATLGVELIANRYGILEPLVPARALVRAQQLDLVLLPLVGFDRSGHRLGMGGGFYDRSLEFLRHRRVWRKPHVIGLAYDFQQVAALPEDVWDIPLDAVVTDQSVYFVS
jgi:5-formyltetrahydrofolate cyclo-ligase